MLLALTCAACGDDGTMTTPDSAVPDGGADAGIVIAPPAPAADAASPSRSCPEGFTTTTDGVCDPWPEGPLDCAPDEIQVPGSDVCERLGPACPGAGQWASDLPSTGTIYYVWADAPAGGDGTRAAPYATIGAAASRAGAGDVIAVAAGTYDEALSLRRGVTLVGACVAGTLVAPSFAAAATLSAAGTGVVAKNVTLGGGGSGIALNRGTGIRLENVRLDGNADFGIRALLGAELVADGLIVRGTRPAAPRGAFGRGIDVEASTATITRALVEDNTDFSIFAAAGTELTLDGVTVRGTRAQQSDGAHGRALNVVDGSTVSAARSVFEDSREIGVFFTGDGTTGTLEDVVIRRTTPSERRAGAESGTGMSVEIGASVEAHGLLVAESSFTGLLTISGASFVGEDVVISTVAPDPFGDLGVGIATERGAHLEVRRGVVRDTHTVAISAKTEGSELVFEDVVVSNVGVRESDGEMGTGVGVVEGAMAVLRRVRLEDLALYGIFANGSGTSVSVEDVTVSRTGTLGGAGFGVISRDAASVSGARVKLTQISEIGILVGMGGASVDLDDVVLEDVTQRFLEEEGVHYGAGVQIEDGGLITLERVSISNAAHQAVFCFGGTLEMTDLRIVSPTEDDSGHFGYGLTATGTAMITLQDTLAEGVFGAGISAFDGAHVIARGLEVRGTQSNTARGTLGWAVAAVEGGLVELEGARLFGNREASIMSQAAGSRIVARDLIIENTLPNSCSEAGTCAGGAGFGATASGGSIELTDFEIRGNALAGVQITNMGSADLVRGTIANNPIGVNVQGDPSYDLDRLTQDVRFVDNERNIDSAVVPLPDASLEKAGLSATPTEAPTF